MRCTHGSVELTLITSLQLLLEDLMLSCTGQSDMTDMSNLQKAQLTMNVSVLLSQQLCECNDISMSGQCTKHCGVVFLTNVIITVRYFWMENFTGLWKTPCNDKAAHSICSVCFTFHCRSFIITGHLKVRLSSAVMLSVTSAQITLSLYIDLCCQCRFF